MGTVFLDLKLVLAFLKDFGRKLIKRGLKHYNFGFEKKYRISCGKIVRNSTALNHNIAIDEFFAHTSFKEDLGWT